MLDWASRGFTVKADIEVTAITLDGRNYNPGDTVASSVALSRPPALAKAWSRSCGTSMAASWRSSRLPARTAATASRSRRPAADDPPYPPRRVASQGKDVAVRRLTFPVCANSRGSTISTRSCGAAPQPVPEAPMLRNWPGLPGRRHRCRLRPDPRTQRRPGQPGGGAVHRGVRDFGSKIATTPNLPMNGCMTAPETRKAIDDLALQSAIYGPYGPLSWTHGDESFYAGHPDTCWSETCLAAFRGFLKGRYSGLEALNAEWRTGYKTWDEVLPLTFEDAVKSGNYALGRAPVGPATGLTELPVHQPALSVHDLHAHSGSTATTASTCPTAASTGGC